MLFHSPLASSSCPLMVKWKQSWVKKVISIFPFCSERKRTHTSVDSLTERVHSQFQPRVNKVKTHGALVIQSLLFDADMFILFVRLPGGGEGQRVSGRAEEQQQSRPWRNGRCTAAPQVFSVDGGHMKVYLSAILLIYTNSNHTWNQHAKLCPCSSLAIIAFDWKMLWSSRMV